MSVYNKVFSFFKNVMNNFDINIVNKFVSLSMLNGVGVKLLFYKKFVKNFQVKISLVESIDDFYVDMCDFSEFIDN